MALATKVISFLQPVVPVGPTVIQAITGVGFQPKLAYFFSTVSSDGAPRASFSEGLDDATTHVGRGAGLGVGVVSGNRGWSSGSFSLIPVNNNSINTILVAGKVNSFDADGLTLHWSSQNGFSANQPRLTWIAVLIGGSGISTKVSTYGWTGTSAQGVTGVGFQPTGLLGWFNNGATSTLGSSGSTGDAGFGAVGTPSCTSQAALAIYATSSGGVTDTKSRLNGSTFTVDINGNKNVITSLDADGFTFTPDVTGVGGYLAYAAVDGCAINADVFTLAGTTGVQTFAIPANSPKLLLTMGIDRPSNTATQDNLLLSAGAATSSAEQMGAWTGTLDAKSGGGFVHNRTDLTRLLTVATPTGAGASTVVAQASFLSFGSRAFSINQTLSDGIARQFLYCVVADATANPCGAGATGSINVIKTCAPVPGGETTFDFTTTGLTPSSFTLADGENRDFTGLGAGTYGVSETAPTGWSASYSVSNGDPHDAIVITTGAVTVTVTNTFQSTAQSLRRLRRFALPYSENKFMRVTRLEIIGQMGVGNASDPNPVIKLRISKDGGNTWGSYRTMSIGAAAQYTKRAYLNRVAFGRNLVAELICDDTVFVAWVQAVMTASEGTS